MQTGRQRPGFEKPQPGTNPAERLNAEPDSQVVQGNARLTGEMAAVLLVLLAAEGATLLSVGQLITPHVFIGMLLVPPVAVKIGSTGWRMIRYYTGSSAYRAKGPPPLVLRLLGPVVVTLTGVVIGSGIALLLVPHSLRNQMFFIHKASFVLWFGAMAVHVLAHLVDTARLAPADLARRTRAQVRGAGAKAVDGGSEPCRRGHPRHCDAPDHWHLVGRRCHQSVTKLDAPCVPLWAAPGASPRRRHDVLRHGGSAASVRLGTLLSIITERAGSSSDF